MAKFMKDIYEDTAKILARHRASFPKDAHIILAKLAGGKSLARAVDSTAVPPCPPDTTCKKCWMHPYCKHSHKALDERLAAIAADIVQKGNAAADSPKEPKIAISSLEQGMEDIL